MMHTESRNKPTEDTEPHPSRYDRKGPVWIGTRKTRALPACDCTKGPQYRNTTTARDTGIGITPVTGARKDANNPRPESERGCNI